MNVTGRKALVTGATGGLGQAIARALAARGARVVVTGRRAELLEPLAAEIAGQPFACDLADPAEVERLLGEAGDADILVANAAVPASGRIDRLTVAEIDAALAVNLRAPMVLGKEMAERLTARGEGHLVFVSSLAGKAASSGGSLYSATKFGLRGFALGLREDLRPHGVGVSVVSPGFIREAGMFHDSGAKLPPGIGTKAPGDVAAAVVRAIERNPPEIDVAPAVLRAGVSFAGLAPNVTDAVARRIGADRVAAELESGQSERR